MFVLAGTFVKKSYAPGLYQLRKDNCKMVKLLGIVEILPVGCSEALRPENPLEAINARIVKQLRMRFA